LGTNWHFGQFLISATNDNAALNRKQCRQHSNFIMNLNFTLVLQSMICLYLIFSSSLTIAESKPLLLKAQHVFDGEQLLQNSAVLVVGDKIKAVGDPGKIGAKGVRVIDLGDATLMPGLIDLHTHVIFQHVSQDVLLEHGITTVRDLGGPLLPMSGGSGRLRLLTAGPIITVPGGYPLDVHSEGVEQGHSYGRVGITVETPDQARQTVRELLAGGAAVIKIALEPGGESGAPWSHHPTNVAPPWPMLSLELIQAIVNETHQHGKRVTAHLSENEGAELALDAGVDEWAHMPCLEIAEPLLQRAALQQVTVVGTLDTLSHCPGIIRNAHQLATFGAIILYGAEIAHPDIPWGIDAEELQLMMHVTGMSPLEVLRTATAKAGKYLGLAPLGTLTPGAPADLVAVKGNALDDLKRLEYPNLVISGGQWIRNHWF
jgi:imidazolonepropionase-like amidohydrolase